MTDTGYDFPEYIDADSYKLLIDYLNTDYLDEQVKNYMMYNFTNAINGDGALATRSATQSRGDSECNSKRYPPPGGTMAHASPQRRRRGGPLRSHGPQWAVWDRRDRCSARSPLALPPPLPLPLPPPTHTVPWRSAREAWLLEEAWHR